MRHISTLSVALAVSFLCPIIAAQDNPYMQMVEMKYADYSQLLHDAYLKFNLLDTIEAQNVILQIEEVAQKIAKKNLSIYNLMKEQYRLEKKLEEEQIKNKVLTEIVKSK